jgi:hypothetical protein
MRSFPTAALLALALALVASSCWAPYYDPKVSSAVLLYKKLGDPFLTIGPVKDEGKFDSQGGLEFLPSRPAANPWNPADGFLVQKGDDYIRIAFVEWYNGDYRLAPAMQSTPNFLGEAALLRSEAALPASPYTPQLIVMADHSSAQQYGFDLSTHSLSWGPGAAISAPASVRVYGLGAHLLMPVATDTDTYAALFSNGTDLLVATDGIDVNLNGFVDAMGSALDAGGRSLAGGGSAFLDQANSRFYYSEQGGPTLLWDTTTWPASSTPPAALPIPERVTALLSDGTLVAQGDDYLSAYSASGKELFSTSAGSVRLEHEVYCPGPTPTAGNYLIFSQVLVVQGKDSSSREYYINVWKYPVSEFQALGK